MDHASSGVPRSKPTLTQPTKTRLPRAARLLAISLGLAAVAAPATASAAPTDELRYGGRMASPTQVVDQSGSGLDGTVLSANGGTVQSVLEADGDRILRFPGETCDKAPCPQAVISPADSEKLIDGGASGTFAFGAEIRLTSPPSPGAGMNVVQFGLALDGEDQWKLQVDYGYPSCRWSDGKTTVLLDGATAMPSRMKVDTWYQVRCARLSDALFELRVLDGATGKVVTSLQDAGDLGPITPDGTVHIGGKAINPELVDAETDQYHGDLDQVFISRG
jgi:hypothetical protein